MVCSIMNRGGAETMVMNYYRQIDREKVQFDFLVHRTESGAYDDEILSMGGRIWRLPALTLRSILQYRRAIDDFFLQHQEYKIVHIHPFGVALFVAMAARKHKIPVVIQHAHCCALDKMDWTTPLRYVCKTLIRPLLTHCFSCGREAAQCQFGKSKAEHAIVLPNAIDATCYRFDNERYRMVREREGWSDRFVIGNVARFSRQKNHPRQLEILQVLLQKRPNALLVCVGERRENFDEVRTLAKRMGLADHVQFTGGRDDVPDLLQGFDVFLFPSFFEGLSVAMIEAQAAGLHIVASDGIAPEVSIVPDRVDFLPLSASNETWAAALLKPYVRRDAYDDICRAGYDIRKNAQWLQQFYLDQVQTME